METYFIRSLERTLCINLLEILYLCVDKEITEVSYRYQVDKTIPVVVV